jgi:exosortase
LLVKAVGAKEKKYQTAGSAHLGLLAIFLVASAALAWHPLVSTFNLAASDEQYTQILLILPVSFAFAYLEWKLVRDLVKPSANYGIGLLGAAGLIAGLSVSLAAHIAADIGLAILMFALVTAWIGGVVLCLGTKVSRRLLFPLCFLYWMVPFPAIVLNGVVRSLQEGSALSTKLLFALARVPVFEDGLHLTIPGLTVEIAKECSSIRSSLLLLVTTMVLAQLFLRSPWRKALVIAVAVPLSVAKNGLRIFVIAMLGTRVDPGYLNGKFHHQGGIVFFLIALLVVFLLLKLLERREGTHARGPAVKSALTCHDAF